MEESPRRSSGRAPKRREVYSPKLEVVKKRDKRRKKARAPPPRSVWLEYERKFDGHLAKARTATHFLESYQQRDHDRRVVPMGELTLAKSRLATSYAAMRAILSEVAALHSETRWATPTTASSSSEDDAGIDVEEVACSICASFESTDDNDIVMCDRAGCFRAFHVKCPDPPLDPETLGGPDDDWFCHQCNTLERCLEKVNEEYDAEWEAAHWEEALVDEEAEAAADAGTREPPPAPGTIGALNVDEEDEDDDFDDAGSVASSSSPPAEDDEGEISGSELAALAEEEPRIDVEVVSEANIVEGPRKRTKVDYEALNAIMFADTEESEDSDDEF